MTTEAPGRPMTARMRAGPIVNAIEGKANVFNAALEQVNEYAVQRQKMINETKRNEAIFGAKEGLLSLVDQLEADENPFDIINMDNKTGRWFDAVAKIKSEMRSKVTQTDAELAYFDQQFTQNEISLRFQLKDKLDTAIETRAKASIESRNQQYIDKYSNPFVDFTLFNEESAEIGAMLNQSVKSGYMAPKLIEALGKDTINDIMKNVVDGYAANNPDYVYGLKVYLDILDEYTGVEDEAELEKRDQRIKELELPNSDWTKIVLGSVDRNEARSALAATLTKANKFETYLAQQIKETDDLIKDQFTNLKLLAFSADLTNGRRQNVAELEKKYDLIFTDTFKAKLADVSQNDGTIKGEQFQDMLLDFLTANNQLSLSEQRDLETKILQTESFFSSEDDPNVVDKLSMLVIGDDADTKYLEDNSYRLTRDTYVKFAGDFEKIGTDQEAETRQALGDVIAFVKAELNFVDKDVMTGEERVSMQSTNSVIAQLRRLVFEEGSELTDYNKIIAKADELLNVEKQNVKRALLPLFGNFLEEVNINDFFRGSISATSTDPGKDLEDRFLSLSAEDQNLLAGLYYRLQGRLNTFIVRGFFE
tara:strand:+ start:928 stop:2706 length:1779 start_codon:yes stop_codon:yes gene_type:complete